MVSVAYAEGSRSLRMPATVGRRTPAYCSAVGKAMLAFLPESALDEGAPVWNYSGEVAAAVSVAGPAFRITRTRVPAMARSVMAMTQRLSAALGYPPSAQLDMPARGV